MRSGDFPLRGQVVGSLLLAVAMLGPGCAGSRVPPQAEGVPSGSLAILQGATSGTVARFSILAPKDTGLEVTVVDADGAELAPVAATPMGRPWSAWVAWSVAFEGLRPASRYWLLARYGKTRAIVDSRSFRTLDPSRRSARVLFASCMDDGYKAEQAVIWKEALAREPDLMVFMGDNVYADRFVQTYTGPADKRILWDRYVDTRRELAVFRAPELRPVVATWDDHDYGQNNSGRQYPHRNESRAIFGAFFPQEAIPGFIEHGPGVSSLVTAYGQRFFVMDSRSFRSPAPEGKGGTHWGANQEKWLLERLGSSPSPAWIINGDQFFGAYHRFESYEGDHPAAFKRFVATLKGSKAPVVFVSGDRHLAELMRIGPEEIGYETFEITTSAIHAKVFPELYEPAKNKRLVKGRADLHNYAVVDAEASSDGASLSLDAAAFGPGGVEIFRQRFRLGR